MTDPPEHEPAGAEAEGQPSRPPQPRRVVVLAERSWEGFYLTATLRRQGVNLIALLVAREPTDGIAFRPLRWYRARRAAGWRRSLWSFLGLPMGPGYALHRLANRRDYPLLGDLRKMGVAVEFVDGFKTPQCHEVLHRLQPDVAVICGTPILPESLLTIPRICTINIHTSLLPHYRGGGSLFWPLFFRDTDKVGFTIHKAVAALDAGPFLYQEQVPVRAQDSPASLLRKCFRAAAPRLAQLLKTDPLNEHSWHEYAHPLRYVFRKPHPLVRQYLLGRSLPERVKGLAKEVLDGVDAVGQRLPRRRPKGRLVALSCHRALPDSTPAQDWRRVLGHATVSELRAKLRYLQNGFCFVSLSRWLHLLSSDEPLDQDYVVLTVDDGYRDFLTNLVPLLQELNLPAALFVCTGAIAAGSVWYQHVYNLIDQVGADRLRVPWMDTAVYFGDVKHRVLTVEYVLLAHLKRLTRSRRQESVRDLLAANRVPLGPSAADAFCSLEDLQRLNQSPLVELYPHGHDHDPFESLSDDELKADLMVCKQFFRDHLGLERNALSYPNARFKESQRRVLQDLGFAYGFTQTAGYEQRQAFDAFALRRNGFGGESLGDFVRQLRRLKMTR